MPVVVDGQVRRLGQDEFGRIAYHVMRHAFDIHRELGRFFEEEVYANELAGRLGDARTQVPVEVRFDTFQKIYRLDLLVGDGAIFELKALQCLNERHRSQLLNYLLLCDAAHGKLVNMRPARIEHEFVNTSLTLGDRRSFSIVSDGWIEATGQSIPLAPTLTSILRDWGTGLELPLYTEAITHLLGGPEQVQQRIDVVSSGRRIGSHPVSLCDRSIAFKITGLASEDTQPYQTQLHRFLAHTSLNAVQWINITPRTVTFKTIKRIGA